MQAKQFSEDLGPFDRASWIGIRDELGRELHVDDSLRGDLAHIFLGIRAASDSKSFPVLARRIQDFEHALAEYTEISMTVSEENILTYPKFIQRETNRLGHKELYINLVLFVAYHGLSQEGDFLQSPIMKEVGGIRFFIAAVMSEIRSAREVKSTAGKSLGESSVLARIRAAIQKAREHRYNEKLNKDVLGGLLENGLFDDRSLWGDLFNVDAKTDAQIALEPSEERYFNCYRMSSMGGAPKIAKSFLVFQSPGVGRNHFTFKAFYRSRSGGLIRRSAGAVLPLGGYIACLGTSLPMGSSLSADYGRGYARGFSGPKVFAFDTTSIQFQERLIPGLAMTVNENERTLVSHTFITPSNKNHSEDAGIGTFLVEDMDGEAESYWPQANSSSRFTLNNRELWKVMIEKLTAASADSCVLGYKKADIDQASIR